MSDRRKCGIVVSALVHPEKGLTGILVIESDKPRRLERLEFKYQNGSIYDALNAAGIKWRLRSR